MSTSNTRPAAPDRAARRAAGRMMGFSIHATVFVLVNLLLVATRFGHGRGDWSPLHMAGWSIGLLVHGLVAFGAFERLRQFFVEREMRRR